ncbi:MAG: hypothetical protein COT06_02105 [Syntrophobacteraceae bacterium CG07_land_8_20_14_0_80_61_8]|nr:MAG: hypothetical protein COT06_02105 [Syntrophobacteraceae bacterium CG07_land_8_20_14_0_80_61_8]
MRPAWFGSAFIPWLGKAFTSQSSIMKSKFFSNAEKIPPEQLLNTTLAVILFKRSSAAPRFHPWTQLTNLVARISIIRSQPAIFIYLALSKIRRTATALTF